MGNSRRTFAAKYHGICERCLGDIDPGDEVGYLDDDLCCEECWERFKDE